MHTFIYPTNTYNFYRYIHCEMLALLLRDAVIMVRTNRVIIMQSAGRINEQRNVIYLMIKALR